MGARFLIDDDAAGRGDLTTSCRISATSREYVLDDECDSFFPNYSSLRSRIATEGYKSCKGYEREAVCLIWYDRVYI
jgi:hypothetical protein